MFAVKCPTTIQTNVCKSKRGSPHGKKIIEIDRMVPRKGNTM